MIENEINFYLEKMNIFKHKVLLSFNDFKLFVIFTNNNNNNNNNNYI